MAILNYLRFALAFIDSGIVWLLRTVYNLFYELTDLMLYSEKIVESLGQRIGLILGIFMLFRLAVSLVNYLISPDKLNDNAKGGGKLLINVVVSLVLLATVNIIFVQAYKIQDIIVSSGFIEKIFFGTKVDTENRQKLDISYYLYTPLFQPNEEVFGDVCKTLWDPTLEIENKDKEENDETGKCDAKLYEILGDDRRAVYRAFNSQDMSYVLSNYNVVTAKQNNEYAFDYKILAPIAGIACALVLISFSMDLAIRAVKLLFLQIIAPIPIIANIDPGKGQDTFKKWYQECLKTYVSVFLRIITIDFAVYMITVLLTEFKELFTSNPFLNIIIIIGALMFAKQVPKLIENIFGIKMEGTMALNPLKKFTEGVPLAAAGLAGVAATGSNFMAGIQGKKWYRLDALAKAGLSAAAGGISATSRGVVGTVKGQKFNEIYKNSYGAAMAARTSRADRKSDNVSWGEMMGARFQQAIGSHAKMEAVDSAKKHISKLQEAYKTMQNQAAAMDTTNFSTNAYSLSNPDYINTASTDYNEEIAKFRTMDFKGIKDLTKFKEQVTANQLERLSGETEAHFIDRQRKHQQFVDDIDGVIAERLNDLALGSDSTGDAATDRAIQDAYATMKKEQTAFNASIDSIDKDVGHIGGNNVKSINGSSMGASARLSVSKEVQHIETVNQYGKKKSS